MTQPADSEAPVTAAGSCLCGRVRFELDMPTLFCGHCHCTMCRRAHGAAYVTWIRLSKDQFRVTSGSDRLETYQSSGHARRLFCRSCGSSLFFETDESPTTIDVVLANVEGEIDQAPAAHIHSDHRVAWAPIDDDLPRLGGEDGLQPID